MNKPIIDKDAMYIAFKLMGKPALGMTHYDLEAACPDYSSEEWKIFLSLPEIREYVKQEMDIIRNQQMNKIVQDSASSRSVGQAQLLSTLAKMNEDTEEATGPIFIYCHTPLSEAQSHAPNVIEMDEYGNPRT